MLRDLAPHPWPIRSVGADLALSFVVYGLLAFAAILVARQPGSIATIWPANGAAIALIVSAPQQRRLVMLLLSGLANVAANLLYGDTLALSLAFVPPNLAEVALGAYLVNRSGRSEQFGVDHRAFMRVLASGALVPPLLGATVGAFTLQMLGFAEFLQVWTDWYIGAALAGVSTLPMVLALRSRPPSAWSPHLVASSSLLAMTVVGTVSWAALRYLPYPFVAISVVLVVIGFVQPRWITFAGAFLVVVMLAASLALGGFVPTGPKDTVSHLFVFGAAFLVVIPAQVVAVVVARQKVLTDMLSAVGSKINDIVVFVDMTGTYRWVNRAREHYWGTPQEAVIGRTWVENTPGDVYKTIVKPMFELALSGEVARRMVEFDYPRLGLRTMDMSMQPASDQDGRQIGVLFCATDITDLEASRREVQRVADQLLAANRNLEQFVRIASHDLREPLNTITQFCGLIEARGAQDLDDESKRYFGLVSHGAARMRAMLDDVLQYVRLEDDTPLEFKLVDLDAEVTAVLQVLAAALEKSGATVHVGPLGLVTSHQALVSLVLQNFISNAIKFVPPGRAPAIAVTAWRDGGEFHLEVADNGIGIQGQRIAELGTPFRRLHARRHFEGTGLGLAICKRIAERLGGRIEIQSQVGVGSQMSLILNIAE